jgi:hypothetical protein
MTGITSGGSRRSGAIPGPPGLPLLGLSLERPRDPLGTNQQAMGTYGDVIRLVVGPQWRYSGRRALCNA